MDARNATHHTGCSLCFSPVSFFPYLSRSQKKEYTPRTHTDLASKTRLCPCVCRCVLRLIPSLTDRCSLFPSVWLVGLRAPATSEDRFRISTYTHGFLCCWMFFVGCKKAEVEKADGRIRNPGGTGQDRTLGDSVVCASETSAWECEGRY